MGANVRTSQRLIGACESKRFLQHNQCHRDDLNCTVFAFGGDMREGEEGDFLVQTCARRFEFRKFHPAIEAQI